MTDRRIVCAAYGGGHVIACLPVLAALRDSGWDIELLALTIAAPVARAAGFEPVAARDLLRDGDDDIVRWGKALSAGLPPGGAIPHEESVAYLGFGYAGLVAEHGEEGAAARYACRGRRALRPVEMIERLLDRGPFDAALATSSPRAERALIERAGARGVPTVCLNNLFAPDRDSWIAAPSFADRICVIHDYVRDELVEQGQDPGKIVITGNPAFEPFIATGVHQPERRNPLRVLYVSQLSLPGDEASVRGLRAELARLAERREDWQINVRPAPAETDLDWLSPSLRPESPGLSVMDSLQQADIVITHGSTMALEAALLGLPVLQHTACKIARYAPFYRIGLAARLEDYADLEIAIEATLARGPAMGSGIPADATDRVVRVIEQLVG